MIRHIFIVEGTGHFPLDMLRYDGCYPTSQVDVNTLQDTGQKGLTRTRGIPWRVELTHTDTRKRWSPTTDRWKSFGWAVLCCEHRG